MPLTDRAASRWLRSCGAPGCHAPRRIGCSNGWCNCAGSAGTGATTSWACDWSSWDPSRCIRTGWHSAAQPFLHELHRATGLVVHLAVLDGSDVVYLEKIAGRTRRRDSHPGRWPSARALHRGRQSVAGVLRSGQARLRLRRRPADPQDPVLDLHPPPADRRTGRDTGPRRRLSSEPNRSPDSVVSQRRSATLVNPIAAVSVCGPLDRMAFDHRLAGPVRTTALSIWRNYDDGGRGARAADPATAAPAALHTGPDLAVRVTPRRRARQAATGAQLLLPACRDDDRAAIAQAVIRERAVPPPHPAPVRAVADRTMPFPRRATSRCGSIGRPVSAMSGPVPVVVFAHGGGFVFCDLDSATTNCAAR